MLLCSNHTLSSANTRLTANQHQALLSGLWELPDLLELVRNYVRNIHICIPQLNSGPSNKVLSWLGRRPRIELLSRIHVCSSACETYVYMLKCSDILLSLYDTSENHSGDATTSPSSDTYPAESNAAACLLHVRSNLLIHGSRRYTWLPTGKDTSCNFAVTTSVERMYRYASTCTSVVQSNLLRLLYTTLVPTNVYWAQRQKQPPFPQRVHA